MAILSKPITFLVDTASLATVANILKLSLISGDRVFFQEPSNRTNISGSLTGYNAGVLTYACWPAIRGNGLDKNMGAQTDGGYSGVLERFVPSLQSANPGANSLFDYVWHVYEGASDTLYEPSFNNPPYWRIGKAYNMGTLATFDISDGNGSVIYICNVPSPSYPILATSTAAAVFPPAGSRHIVWNSGDTYAINEYAYSGGIIYISLQASNLNHTPASNPTWWAPEWQRVDTPFLVPSVNPPDWLIATTFASGQCSLYDPITGNNQNESPNTTTNNIRSSGRSLYQCVAVAGSGDSGAGTPMPPIVQLLPMATPNWSSGTTYALGRIVIFNSNRYQSLINGNLGNTPPAHTDGNWTDVLTNAYVDPITKRDQNALVGYDCQDGTGVNIYRCIAASSTNAPAEAVTSASPSITPMVSADWQLVTPNVATGIWQLVYLPYLQWGTQQQNANYKFDLMKKFYIPQYNTKTSSTCKLMSLVSFPEVTQTDWVSNITYPTNTMVLFNGTWYLSLQGNNIGNQPDISPTFWQTTVWSSSITYGLNNQVISAGINYTSLQANNTNHPPASSPTFWSTTNATFGNNLANGTHWNWGQLRTRLDDMFVEIQRFQDIQAGLYESVTEAVEIDQSIANYNATYGTSLKWSPHLSVDATGGHSAASCEALTTAILAVCNNISDIAVFVNGDTAAVTQLMTDWRT